MDIVFVTHSITVDNENGRATGWLPGKLSERGRELARGIAVQHPHESFATIYASDLARALETVEAAFGSESRVVPDSRLRECNYGRLNGAMVSEIEPRSRHIRKPFPTENPTLRSASESGYS